MVHCLDEISSSLPGAGSHPVTDQRTSESNQAEGSGEKG